MQLDWGVGRYETTADQLRPAAEVAVARAAVQPGEHAVDLGCGTGNAALLLAGPGVRVTGVDPATRLLEVARSRAAAAGREVSFVEGTASAIPLGAGDADVVVSVFGAIFAPDADAAVAEMARVVAQPGRIVLTAWVPTGAMVEMNVAAARAVMRALGAPEPPPPFAWHDLKTLEAAVAPHGFVVEIEEHTLAYRGESVDAFVELESRNHPMAVQGMAVLEQFGQAEALKDQIRSILTAANEDADGFRVTSPYVVVTARR